MAAHRTGVIRRKVKRTGRAALRLPTLFVPEAVRHVDGRTLGGKRLRRRYFELVEMAGGPAVVDGSRKAQNLITLLLRREAALVGLDCRLLDGAGGRRVMEAVSVQERRLRAMERELARIGRADALRARFVAAAGQAA